MHMEVILYNPLSSKGKNIVKAHKLKSKLEKKGLEVRIENLLTIHDVKGFLAPFN
jgi:diacylglycerol kinase (ATP)